MDADNATARQIIMAGWINTRAGQDQAISKIVAALEQKGREVRAAPVYAVTAGFTLVGVFATWDKATGAAAEYARTFTGAPPHIFETTVQA